MTDLDPTDYYIDPPTQKLRRLDVAGMIATPPPPRITYEAEVTYGLDRPKIPADPDDPLAAEREEQRHAREFIDGMEEPERPTQDEL